jgi:hypothetical protein
MGMYTEFRFEAELTDAGVRVVEKLMELRQKQAETMSSRSPWYEVMPLLCDIAKDYGADPTKPLPYLNQRRRDFIPWGAQAGTEQQCELEGNTWKVLCELKNYDDTIRSFCTYVLPLLLSEPVTTFYHYEEDMEPTPMPVAPLRPVLREVSDVG